jgi:hypothetical protein
MFRPQILACIVVFAIVMLGIRFAAHGIVDNFGTTAGLVVLAAMLGAAWLYDGRHRDRP